MRLNLEDIKIKVKVLDQAILKAIVGLDFGDFVVRGFRVQKSQFKDNKGGELWITPPSYQAKTGKYHPIFYILDKDQWEKLQGMIMDKYYSETKEYHRKLYDLPKEEGVNVEDIDF